ncbi:hypothetical protein PC120_g3831 [Phytophthora cactorum]|nr:hypothetical protein PC120_g3831 [Phytophthora cactorum]
MDDMQVALLAVGLSDFEGDRSIEAMFGSVPRSHACPLSVTPVRHELEQVDNFRVARVGDKTQRTSRQYAYKVCSILRRAPNKPTWETTYLCQTCSNAHGSGVVYLCQAPASTVPQDPWILPHAARSGMPCGGTALIRQKAIAIAAEHRNDGLGSSRNSDSEETVPPPPARAPVVPTPRRGSAGDTEEEPTADALLEQLTTLLTVPDAISVVTTMFSNITTSDIRQESGKTYNNAGELLPSGLATMIAVKVPLDENDVFRDVGAGIGNVLAQVALTTKVSTCLGVEMRRDLCSLSVRHMRHHADAYPLHRNVVMASADVRDVSLSSQAPISKATIILANYFLFEKAAKLVLARENKHNAERTFSCFNVSLLPTA